MSLSISLKNYIYIIILICINQGIKKIILVLYWLLSNDSNIKKDYLQINYKDNDKI